ncbi:sigma-70 family RNA polymerase sigma factor [Lacticaseibacillus rhamnosus]|uniref:sigma factor-like helix-turn-helix DNA-binding protein n=1 Tax=Lacticaseibacillus rhamnosus TaxID=47715 RepID=UPI0021A6FB86|nr:sigma factor-like helix-turn-helix DNA-binding protein [Lacticaseibacillus rhamnosus]MCT3192181.1 sigma-70 family RNA polymerase sigma factor [Lacticaseibacillus rhamnosus]MCT3371267.1 sigma-70 family RNA polymerase sigma factor [Lacticaseibacillus rhamnosus]
MKTDQEVSKIFVAFINISVVRRKRELFRASQRRITLIPVQDSVLDSLVTPSFDAPLFDKAPSTDIVRLELYVENYELSEMIRCLNKRQKFILYYKFVADYSDAEIGALLGISAQSVGAQRRNIYKLLRSVSNINTGG